MTTSIAFVFAVIIFSSSAFADTFKADNELAPFADGVMTKVAKGDLNGAFDAMKPFVVISATEFESAALGSRSQREQYAARYGKTVGYE